MRPASPTHFTQTNQPGPEFPCSCSKMVPWERRPPSAGVGGDSSQGLDSPRQTWRQPRPGPRGTAHGPAPSSTGCSHRPPSAPAPLPPPFAASRPATAPGAAVTAAARLADLSPGPSRQRDAPSLRGCPRRWAQRHSPPVPCPSPPSRHPRTCRQRRRQHQQQPQPRRDAQRPHPANSSRCPRPRCHVRGDRAGPAPPTGGAAEARALPALFVPRAPPSPSLTARLLRQDGGARQRPRAAAAALRLPAAGQPGLRAVLAAAGAQPGAPRHRPRQPHPPQVRLQPAGPPQPLPGGSAAAPHRERPPRARQRLAPVRRGLPGTGPALSGRQGGAARGPDTARHRGGSVGG